MNMVILNYGLLFAMPMDQANLYYCQTQLMIAHCGEHFKITETNATGKYRRKETAKMNVYAGMLNVIYKIKQMERVETRKKCEEN